MINLIITINLFMYSYIIFVIIGFEKLTDIKHLLFIDWFIIIIFILYLYYLIFIR